MNSRSVVCLCLGFAALLLNANGTPVLFNSEHSTVWSAAAPSSPQAVAMLNARAFLLSNVHNSFLSEPAKDIVEVTNMTELFFPDGTNFTTPWDPKANPGCKVWKSPSIADILNTLMEDIVPGLNVTFNQVFDAMQDAGCPVYVFGGMVRDSILGKTAKDTDVAFSCTAERVAEIADQHGWEHSVPKHGYIKLGHETEGHKDQMEGKESTTSLYAPNTKREFACNSLFFDTSSNKAIVDPTGTGVPDTLSKVVRIPGPEKEWPAWAADAKKLFRFWKMRIAPKSFGAEPDTLKFVVDKVHDMFTSDNDGAKELASSFFNSRIAGLPLEKQKEMIVNLRKAMSDDLGAEWYATNILPVEPVLNQVVFF